MRAVVVDELRCWVLHLPRFGFALQISDIL